MRLQQLNEDPYPQDQAIINLALPILQKHLGQIELNYLTTHSNIKKGHNLLGHPIIADIQIYKITHPNDQNDPNDPFAEISDNYEDPDEELLTDIERLTTKLRIKSDYRHELRGFIGLDIKSECLEIAWA